MEGYIIGFRLNLKDGKKTDDLKLPHSPSKKGVSFKFGGIIGGSELYAIAKRNL